MKYESEMANKLKEILNQMSQEQFDKEWSDILALNLVSPHYTDVFEYFSQNQQNTTTFEFNVEDTSINDSSNQTHNLAA